MKQSLSESIEKLYAIFSKYPLRDRIEGCPCCFSEGEQTLLHSRTLNVLEWEDLDGYSAHALLTVGDIDDFKHFLPRIFELRVHSTPDWPDLEVIFGKLRIAGIQNWPAEEKMAVTDFLISLWKIALSQFPMKTPFDCDISALVCALAKSEIGMTEFLEYWAGLSDEASALHLSDFLYENINTVIKKQSFTNAYWEKEWPERVQLIEWLRQGPLMSKLEDAFFKASSEKNRELLSEGQLLLQSFQ